VIYADFSGYTDIAIGVAKLLGFEFPKNFDRPYSARSLQDFWRRWHMTLSRWLRDYLYIPLGGSRRGEPRTYLNIMITMALGGLWHGAAWTFVCWGAYHGVGQTVGAWRRNRAAAGADPAATGPGRVWIQRLATFNLVCLGWVFFRADSMSTALSMLGRLVTGWSTQTTLVHPMVLFAIGGALALQLIPRTPASVLKERVAQLRPAAMGVVFGLVLVAIASLGPAGVAPFIYFRF
jgi:D-alanyl-lipoteichoic acid acyltransferase DltB (MBOAT superfamily)